MNRRLWLTSAAWGLMAMRPASAADPVRIAAAWKNGAQHQVGVLRQADGELNIESALDLPSRPHAVRVGAGAGGVIFAAGRRPGEWLLRWPQDGAAARWQWSEPDRCFNGHMLPSHDGRRLFTTETDLATGQGLIGVRDAVSLEKIAEWPCHGPDAHDLVLEGSASLLVANGGVPSQQETGRLKLRLADMDASLVRLDAGDGTLRGQWRLADKRLSLRHLAWGAPDAKGGRTLGIALQAEHSDAAARLDAPLLAIFDGDSLRLANTPADTALAGYGGDIACIQGFFVVSCPRADALALWRTDGRWHGQVKQAQASALTTAKDAQGNTFLWAAGQSAAAWRPSATETVHLAMRTPLHFDNHWAWLAPGGNAPFNPV